MLCKGINKHLPTSVFVEGQATQDAQIVVEVFKEEIHTSALSALGILQADCIGNQMEKQPFKLQL